MWRKRLIEVEIWVSKPISTESDVATPAMLEDNLLPFSFPAVERKKVTAAFGLSCRIMCPYDKSVLARPWSKAG
jgi:hypothetical protein